MSLLKALFKTAMLPVTVAMDVATLGGTIVGEKQPYTASQLDEINEEVDK